MYEIQMTKGALKVLEVCASVKPGEEVLILADYNMERIGKALATAAYQLGAEPILTYLVPRQRDGQEPPKAVAEAMKRAEVFLAPVSKSITHTSAVKEAAAAGARGLMLTQFRDDMLVHGGIEAHGLELVDMFGRGAEAGASGEVSGLIVCPWAVVRKQR